MKLASSKCLLLGGLVLLAACGPITDPRPRRQIETRSRETLDRVDTIPHACHIVVAAHTPACDTTPRSEPHQ